MEIEDFDVEPNSLISYYLWADDIGPDGSVRRNYSDMFFAEIRPFEEIFREDQSGGASQEQQQGGEQGGGGAAMELAELQKEIINATWNIQRRESGRSPSSQYTEDVDVVVNSQSNALSQLEQLSGAIESEADQAKAQQAKEAMEQTMDQLANAAGANSTQPLPTAIGSARKAYHYLLQLQPDEFQVSQQQGGGGGGGGGRSQQQLNELEMADEADRYETQSEAASQQSEEQNEQLQVLNRLKELARRQQDLNQRLQELQTALNEADTEQEKEEIEQQLKRLQDEQREMVEDMDEVRQRVANQDTPESAEALSQLDQIRSEAQEAAEALEDQEVTQALAAGTRTQQELEDLRDDYRKENSGQFSQAMQDLKARASELANRQDAIEEDLDAATRNDRQSLGESEEATRVMENIAQQKEELESLLEEIRSISEDSESSEPLLSRQLYETYRSTDPAQLNEQLDYTSQLARLNLIDKAQEFEQQSHEAIDELKDRVDRAAESVLGDGVESLRRARLALDEILDDVETEIASNIPTGTEAAGQEGSGTPSPQGTQPGSASNPDQERPDDEAQQLASSEPGQGAEPGTGNGEQAGEGQGASESPEGQGQGSGRGEGRGPGEEQVAQAEQGQGGQGGQGQQGEGEGQGGAAGEASEPGDETQQASNGQGGQGRGGQGDGGGQGGEGGGRSNSPRNNWNIGSNDPSEQSNQGPLTGDDFREFSDQLREVEEMIDVPELQNEVAAVRDRARAMRIDYKRNGVEPQWDLVQMEIEKPLAEIRKRVGEELAKRLSREAVVPIDRDPVPQKYSELVRRYYETLGEGE